MVSGKKWSLLDFDFIKARNAAAAIYAWQSLPEDNHTSLGVK
jgi:hypothetical protein